MTSSWFFLSTLNYDARSTTHQVRQFANIIHNTSQTQETNISFLNRIRIRDPSNHAAYAALQAGSSRVLSGRAVVLGLTEPLTEMSTKDISWGSKGGRFIGLVTVPPSGADFLQILYRNCSTFVLSVLMSPFFDVDFQDVHMI